MKESLRGAEVNRAQERKRKSVRETEIDRERERESEQYLTGVPKQRDLECSWSNSAQ